MMAVALLYFAHENLCAQRRRDGNSTDYGRRLREDLLFY